MHTQQEMTAPVLLLLWMMIVSKSNDCQFASKYLFWSCVFVYDNVSQGSKINIKRDI